MSANHLSPITDSLWLQTQLSQPDLKLIDVRSTEAYWMQHIPGAVHFNIEAINLKQPPVSGLLIGVAEFNTMMSALGLNNTDSVIVYDESGGPSAARLVWTLKAFGHTNSALLNGGFNGWLATGGKTETHIPDRNPSNYQGKLTTDRIADRQYIQQHLHDKNVVLLDARTLAEYEGKDKRAARGGHIPGAVHFDWNHSKEPDTHHFKVASELNPQLQALGITPDKEIICYCQSHQRSSVMCLLLEALGYPRVKGYPGAWSDWGNTLDTPVE